MGSKEDGREMDGKKVMSGGSDKKYFFIDLTTTSLERSVSAWQIARKSLK